MCRWLSYLGRPTTLYRFLYDEDYSLIEQSIHARKSKSVVNADGFGIGWYGDTIEPNRFRDVLPAWSDENLLSLSKCIQSKLFMAHVRGATDTTISRTNCHPFTYGRNMFIHNGQIGDYLLLRRQIENLIPDELYPYRIGTTDSEALFLYLLKLLEDNSFHTAAQKLIESVESIMLRAGVNTPFRCTSAYSDGEKLCFIRYASDNKAPSLYYNRYDDNWVVVSEPLDDDKTRWLPVPSNHTMIIDSMTSDLVIKSL